MFVFVFDDSWEAWQNVICVLCLWPPGLELREEKSGTISFRVLQKATTSNFQFVFSAALWTCNLSRSVCIHFCFVLREQSVNITAMKCFWTAIFHFYVESTNLKTTECTQRTFYRVCIPYDNTVFLLHCHFFNGYFPSAFDQKYIQFWHKEKMWRCTVI